MLVFKFYSEDTKSIRLINKSANNKRRSRQEALQLTQQVTAISDNLFNQLNEQLTTLFESVFATERKKLSQNREHILAHALHQSSSVSTHIFFIYAVSDFAKDVAAILSVC